MARHPAKGDLLMRKTPSTLALLALALAACAPKMDLDAARASLRAADEQWSAVAGAKNAAGFAAAFAADARLLPPNSPAITGAENFHKFASELMANPGFALAWKPAVAEVAASGDLGYTLGAYELTLATSDGMPMTDKGKYVTVWKKQADGQWKVVADTFNSDLPPPGSAPPAPAPSSPSP